MSSSDETGVRLRLRFEGNWVESDKIITIPTGSWRFQRPVTRLDKCCQCGQCYIFCPTGSILEKEDRFAIDLKNCKGCGICARVCPNAAISMIEEPDE
ncbi:MAG: 4Fe-4S binding protein [Deltaproteobacteria bacterium]|nr:4Fe-4S binding protein [Deltaproteobacteria bacterium]